MLQKRVRWKICTHLHLKSVLNPATHGLHKKSWWNSTNQKTLNLEVKISYCEDDMAMGLDVSTSNGFEWNCSSACNVFLFYDKINWIGLEISYFKTMVVL